MIIMKTQFLRAIPAMLVTLLATFAVVVNASSEIYYIHNDHLGTPQVLTDKDQNVVWTADQTPFGQLENETGSVEQHIRFPGQYADQETGYYYNYYRDYDPSLGRYIQSDPIGLRGGMNTYGYVYQNPLKYTDSKGLCPWCISGGIAAGVNVAGQLWQNGGDVGSVDLGEAALAFATGALLPGLAGAARNWASTGSTIEFGAAGAGAAISKFHRQPAGNHLPALSGANAVDDDCLF